MVCTVAPQQARARFGVSVALSVGDPARHGRGFRPVPRACRALARRGVQYIPPPGARRSRVVCRSFVEGFGLFPCTVGPARRLSVSGRLASASPSAR